MGAGGIATGAVAGGAMGALAGPVGIVIGGLVGAVVGGFATGGGAASPAAPAGTLPAAPVAQAPAAGGIACPMDVCPGGTARNWQTCGCDAPATGPIGTVPAAPLPALPALPLPATPPDPIRDADARYRVISAASRIAAQSLADSQLLELLCPGGVPVLALRSGGDPETWTDDFKALVNEADARGIKSRCGGAPSAGPMSGVRVSRRMR